MCVCVCGGGGGEGVGGRGGDLAHEFTVLYCTELSLSSFHRLCMA